MRRSWFQVLLFLVALTIQVMAPMAGNLAHAKAFQESGVSTFLCQSTDGSSVQGKGTPNHLSGNRQCLLCQSVCDALGFTLSDDQTNLVSASSWVIGAFPSEIDASPASREVGLYQARAPPNLIQRLG